MSEEDRHPNPFKGTLPRETGDRIFGRDREQAEIFQLLVAQRILVLHAPSGAGKTSLVQAGLIPVLKDDGFHVFPVARVHHGPTETPAGDKKFNRYIYSLLHSLEEKLPSGEEKRSDKELTALTLEEYLEPYLGDGEQPKPAVLIVDQFEEVFKDPIDIEDKEEFFYMLGKALRNSNLWALFAIRDDYMGALRDKRYMRPIPTQFANTYHLELLDVDAAGQAIQKTAALGKRKFKKDALNKLVNDLSRVQVQQPDGSFRPELGPHVEPVQLQVVCEQLWEELPPETTTITDKELVDFGNVDQSLA